MLTRESDCKLSIKQLHTNVFKWCKVIIACNCITWFSIRLVRKFGFIWLYFLGLKYETLMTIFIKVFENLGIPIAIAKFNSVVKNSNYTFLQGIEYMFDLPSLIIIWPISTQYRSYVHVVCARQRSVISVIHKGNVKQYLHLSEVFFINCNV